MLARSIRAGAASALTVVGLLTGSAVGQVWTIPSAPTVFTNGAAHADRLPIPGVCDDTAGSPSPYLPATADFAAGRQYYCGLTMVTCPVYGRGIAQVWAEGVGTPTVKIRWDVIAFTYNNCPELPFTAYGTAALAASIPFEISGVAPGTPVTVDYIWQQFSSNGFDPEVLTPPDDPTFVQSGTVTLNGGALFAGSFDMIDVKGVRWVPGTAGTFGSVGGASVVVGVQADVRADIDEPGVGPFQEDRSSAAFQGEIILSLAGPPAPQPAWELVFSQDIGADTELSDPAADGNERFDPGDAYLWKGPPFAAPVDGARDDAIIFAGLDFPPDDDDLTSFAPACSGLTPADVSHAWFDRDGDDSVGAEFLDLIPNTALHRPIPRFASECIVSARYLVVSFDDDAARHYAAAGPCEIPVTSLSPGSVLRGGTVQSDEVCGLHVFGGAPAVMVASYDMLHERSLHEALLPNPDAASMLPMDDDVDSLDAFLPGDACTLWLFSADHEATGLDAAGGPLDPGDVYAIAGGPVRLVDDVVHLGLSDETDVDAFEFVWTPDDTGGEVLALLFSVDDDDPMTGSDESGGLDPAAIYCSYLTGVSFAYLEAPLQDDVDAIAASRHPMADPVPHCPADVDASGTVDVDDLIAVVLAWGPCTGGCPADVIVSGVVDVDDLLAVILGWGPC
ncbi:MAG: hypothetical protein ACYTJ0_00895 [Planctomycetota bacterium]|jgi:hypothetical protein